jgi:hypothetical protein
MRINFDKIKRMLFPTKIHQALFTPKIEQVGDLTRQRIEDIEYPVGDWRWSGVHKLFQYKYWCKCGTVLTDGPSGGCSVNAVCEKCRINYGCLDGYYGR